VTLAHDLAGDGPDVVLIHEAIGDRHLWDDQWRWLTAEYRVLRPDLRGFGQSPLTAEPFTHAQDVIDLMAEVGMADAVVAAGSMGGRVALELAVARPDLVRALVLVSPAMPGVEWSTEMEAYGDAEDRALEAGDLDTAVELNLRMWLDGTGRERAEVSDDRRATLAAMQRRAFEVQLALRAEDGEQLQVDDLAERVAEITVPTVVLVGEHDVAEFHAIGLDLMARLERAEYRLLPGVAHAPNFEDPEGFNPHLAEALARFS
jgi:3-oxoadipate enol-lactonase